MIEIPLSKGYVTVIDDVDADLAPMNWYACVTPSGTVYVIRALERAGKRTSEGLHRVIVARMEGRVLARTELSDHRDRDGLNNCRWNLRLATNTQNMQNHTHSRSASGIRGVYWIPARQKWHAEIIVNGKCHFLGQFLDINEAVAARTTAELEFYGEFSPLYARRGELS